MADPDIRAAIGVIDGVNVDFTTPDTYISGSLWAYLNGVLVDKEGDEGPIELGGNQVQMRIAPSVGDTLHFYYQRQSAGPTVLTFRPPPLLMSALDLVPRQVPFLLSPITVDASEETSENVPIQTATVELKPSQVSLNLRPTMISAEEE